LKGSFDCGTDLVERLRCLNHPAPLVDHLFSHLVPRCLKGLDLGVYVVSLTFDGSYLLAESLEFAVEGVASFSPCSPLVF
jgi:hypothetical protein